MVSALVVDGQRGLRWHRFSEVKDHSELAQHVRALTDLATRHGHEFHVMSSFYDATVEVQRALERASAVRDGDLSSFVAAGFKERHLYMPITAFGMFEGEVFDIFEIGALAGVRVIFIGTTSDFQSLPYLLMNSTDTSGVLCGCEGGF